MTFTLPPPGQILKWLGGQLDVRVDFDTGLEGVSPGLWGSAIWDEDLWGTKDPVWAEGTEFVMSVEIKAGTARWGERFESASCVITVDNTTGIFTPDAEVPYWYQELRPGRRMRVSVVPDPETGERWPIFTGQIDSMNDRYDEAGFNLSTTLICSDYMARMAAYDPTMLESPTGQQMTDERVNAALDRMGWSATERDIQPGDHTMQTSALAQTTLEECQRAADAEGGVFYTDRLGKAVFKARDWLTTDPRSVDVVGYLGYDEVPVGALTARVLEIETTHEAARIVNHVAFAFVGGHLIEADDFDSRGLHGVRSYQRTDLENDSVADTTFLVNRYLSAFAIDRQRVDSVTITPIDDPDGEDLNRMFYDIRFGDRLAIRVRPPFGWDYEKEVHVMALHHFINAEDWVTTLLLDDAQTFEGEVL